MNRILNVCFIMLLPVLSHVWAAENADISAEDIQIRLKALQQELEDYRQQLESTESQKSDLERTLERNEKSINNLINEIDRLDKEIEENEDRVSRLSRQQKELLASKSEQQEQIAKQIRAAFEIGNQEYLKVLLNQEDPNEIARMLTFYDYFNEARATQIEGYNRTLDQLDRVSAGLATETAELRDNRSTRQSQRQTLAATQQERQKTLTALIREIESTGNAIGKLETDRTHLEQLLEKLQTSLANIPTPGSAKPFSGMKGKLILPADGKVSHRFGHRRNQGKMKWNGVFIEADRGEPVYAVHYGRVVFSDWLRGFGLLMIISHGEGYMSLYGHNEVLYFETGDWVTAGEMIATVGDTGGQTTAGLYFEIRQSGKPSDPMQWCVARDQRAA